MKLAQCPLRVRAQITGIDVSPQFLLRLQELGLRPGAEFIAINKAAFGGRVLNIGGTRVAIDHDSAKRIEARLLEVPS